MTDRISLIEAYDNRDIIAQLVRLRTDVDELMNILKDIDPDGDLTNVVTKSGDQTIDGVKTFIGKIVADCDIIQNGAAYETHAEQVFSTKDYIVLRDGALGGLSPGDFSGLRVNKYDSVNDGHLVMDRDGVARVGDVNDEQPLATRDEAADMTSGALVKWDGVNLKMIAPSSNAGSDSKPLKQVNGELVPVADDLVTADILNWTDVTNDLSKIATAHEVMFSARENHTFTHTVVLPYAITGTAYTGVSVGANYYNVSISAGGISVISSAGTWDNVKVYVR